MPPGHSGARHPFSPYRPRGYLGDDAAKLRAVLGERQQVADGAADGVADVREDLVDRLPHGLQEELVIGVKAPESEEARGRAVRKRREEETRGRDERKRREEET
ncbi:hypothetical protein EYF80_012573 [Liparis tanakae]|uniref:Uncharacterized protein n=1 Tax=Liparis tanakae TaxID=230148 RepID=A0A4Z2IH43_9TELE|nr:hypothetical protein EYF80_012573 [Liparis tanakae]